MDRNDVLWQCQVHRWLLLTSGYCTVTILTPMAQEPLNFTVAATSAAADRRQKTTATGSTNRSTHRFVDLVYVPYGTCMYSHYRMSTSVKYCSNVQYCTVAAAAARAPSSICIRVRVLVLRYYSTLLVSFIYGRASTVNDVLNFD